MKTDPEKLHALLDEVVPPAGGENGPTAHDVQHMVRRERSRRRRLRGGIVAGVAGVACLLFVLQSRAPRVDREDRAPLAVAPPAAKAPSIEIQQVNDQQLLALLQGTPSALMEWPDGRRTLLVIEQR